MAIAAAAFACCAAVSDELDDLLEEDVPAQPAEEKKPAAAPKEKPDAAEDAAPRAPAATPAPANAPDAAPAASGDDGAAENGGETDGSGEQGAKLTFDTLPYCSAFSGVAEVLVPGSGGKWKSVERDRRYALGSQFRTVGKDSRLEIRFSIDSKVLVRGDSSFGTRAQPIGAKNREITLAGGSIWVKLPPKLAPGMFSVNAPGFTVKDMKGESRFFYSAEGDGDTATLRCVTHSFAVEGRHFKLLEVASGREVKIRTSQDLLFTGIYGSKGDVVARLDTGLHKVRDFDTGEERLENQSFDWKLLPRTAVRIHRAVPAIGEKMAVCVMAFDENGTLRENRSFAENTLGVAWSGPAFTSKKEREALQKRVEDAAAGADGNAGSAKRQ